MSQYIPNPIYLRVTRRDDGYWVDDQFAPIDGPYASSADAWSVVYKMECYWYDQTKSN